MEETNQSAHPPSVPPTRLFIEIKLHAALVFENSLMYVTVFVSWLYQMFAHL